MNRNFQASVYKRIRLYSGLLLILLCSKAAAHGGVMIEEDQCIIQFGFYKAHFTVYQPSTSQDKEFCEDLPDSGPTLFVLSYLHNSLAQVPVDFRIIRNFTDLGRFAKWSDLEKIENLESYSVFYQAPVLRPEGVLMIEHEFDKAGDYIGIVTAKHPTNDKIYRAVFPFQVGSRRFYYGLIAVTILGLALLQYGFRVFNILIDGIKGAVKKIRELFSVIKYCAEVFVKRLVVNVAARTIRMSSL